MSLSVDVLARPFALVVFAIDSAFNDSLEMLRRIDRTPEFLRSIRQFRHTLRAIPQLQWFSIAQMHPRPITRRVQYDLLFDHLRDNYALLDALDVDHLIYDIASGRADYREHLSFATQEMLRPGGSLNHAPHCECTLCMTLAQEWSW